MQPLNLHERGKTMEKDPEWDRLPRILSLGTVQRLLWGDTNQNEIFAAEIKCPMKGGIQEQEQGNLLQTHTCTRTHTWLSALLWGERRNKWKSAKCVTNKHMYWLLCTHTHPRAQRTLIGFSIGWWQRPGNDHEWAQRWWPFLCDQWWGDDKAFSSCVIIDSNEPGFENLKARSFEIPPCPPSSSSRVWLIRPLKQRKQELPFLQRQRSTGVVVVVGAHVWILTALNTHKERWGKPLSAFSSSFGHHFGIWAPLKLPWLPHIHHRGCHLPMLDDLCLKHHIQMILLYYFWKKTPPITDSVWRTSWTGPYKRETSHHFKLCPAQIRWPTCAAANWLNDTIWIFTGLRSVSPAAVGIIQIKKKTLEFCH